MNEHERPRRSRKGPKRAGAPAPQAPAPVRSQAQPAVAYGPQYEGPPESWKDLFWRIVKDNDATKNVIKLVSACGGIVLAVLAMLAALVFLVTQASWMTWIIAAASCLGTGGVAAGQWRRLKRRRGR